MSRIPVGVWVPAIAFLLAGEVSAQVNLKFCFKVEATYVDAADGTDANEDYWRHSVPTSRPARGIKARVVRSATEVFNDYTGDGLGSGDPGLGCAVFSAAGTGWFQVELWSEGKIQGNTLSVKDDDGDLYFVAKDVYVSSGGTYTIDLGDPGAVNDNGYNAYQAMAYALYRHAGGLSNATFSVEVEYSENACLSGAGVGNCHASGKIWLSSLGSQRKFIMIHELGHRLNALTT